MAVLRPGSQAYADAMKQLGASGGLSGTQAKQPQQTTSRPQYSQGTSYDPMAGYMSQIQAQLQAEAAARQQAAEQAAAARRQAAETAYQTGVGQVSSAYGAGKESLQQQSEKDLQQAYIRRMQEERALPQQLQALGISGGGTESALAGLRATYGTNRAAVQEAAMGELGRLERERASQLAELENIRAQNLAAADIEQAQLIGQARSDLAQKLASQYASATPRSTTSRYTGGQTGQTPNKTIASYVKTLITQGLTAQEIDEMLEKQGASEQERALQLGSAGLLG